MIVLDGTVYPAVADGSIAAIFEKYEAPYTSPKN